VKHCVETSLSEETVQGSWIANVKNLKLEIWKSFEMGNVTFSTQNQVVDTPNRTPPDQSMTKMTAYESSAASYQKSHEPV
jgi:hypothetical protein